MPPPCVGRAVQSHTPAGPREGQAGREARGPQGQSWAVGVLARVRGHPKVQTCGFYKEVGSQLHEDQTSQRGRPTGECRGHQCGKRSLRLCGASPSGTCHTSTCCVSDLRFSLHRGQGLLPLSSAAPSRVENTASTGVGWDELGARLGWCPGSSVHMGRGSYERVGLPLGRQRRCWRGPRKPGERVRGGGLLGASCIT